MMLDHLGEGEYAEQIRTAVSTTIALGQVTPDLYGNLSTQEMTEQIIASL